jgi:hypothetical protein
VEVQQLLHVMQLMLYCASEIDPQLHSQACTTTTTPFVSKKLKNSKQAPDSQ